MPTPRLHCPTPLATGRDIDLPPEAARHAQVLRLQPGHRVTLFNGEGGEWDAVVERMGRADVRVAVGHHHAIEREAARDVHLSVGLCANERMDGLVEKATELGVASIQPLALARSVLRLERERAAKRRQHWQAVAVAACEQCGRNRVPVVHPIASLADWLALRERPGVDVVLSLSDGAQPLGGMTGGQDALTFLSGPEGGLAPEEEKAAREAGFMPCSLGPRVLRADTAPIAALAALTLR